ncbi:Arabinose efflux permease [Rubrobacter radiotolerans]|uniref:Arabinose efflux permease n=1 Tax=Rubrobacter radiotolerans TaxID=42256 RepID=A0A023WZ35_RUBRA|nr:MFS transporter [Rubrobacter radiotolerans]AHY45482.1 Arabinose efflux permease [Rubrobacter radiotolerans]MDX5892893.1 MFS transporter [Rubrobacter radiotolerans]SMC02698.1 MFS transporter, DHA1 family, putative efflux transporter [Rubrobacter radiotolerans DSM 5868]
MNLRLLVLALGTFAIGTGSFVFAGLLEGVAAGMGVSVPAAGNLITVFALTYALAAPPLATLTSNVPRRTLLFFAMALFLLANLASAFAPSFEVLLVSRVVAALGAAMFTPNAAAVASSLAAPEARGRALSVVTGGMTVAFVLGIPFGSLVGAYFGWRSTFVLVGILALVALAGVRSLPAVPSPPAVSLAERVGILRRVPVLVTLLIMMLGMLGGFVAFTYIGPILSSVTGFGGFGVSVLLLVFGGAAVVGNSLGGYGADNFNYRRFVAALVTVQSLSLLALSPLFLLSGTVFAVAAAGAVLVVWGAAGFALNPLQQHRLTRLAPEAQNVALSLNASSIYLGQGLGAGLGALALGPGSLSHLGLVAAASTVCALFVVLRFVEPAKPQAPDFSREAGG